MPPAPGLTPVAASGWPKIADSRAGAWPRYDGSYGQDPAPFFAVCARLIGPEVKITIDQSLPGNLSAQDWQVMREIVEAVKLAVPDASFKPPGEVLEYVRARLTSD